MRLLAAYDGRSVIVQNVYARSEAPLKRGDRIIRADDHVLASDADWFVVLFTLRVSKPVVFEIQRDTQYLEVEVPVIPGARWPAVYFNPVLVFVRIGQMMMLAVACFVAFARPRDPAALLAALFFSGLSLLNVQARGVLSAMVPDSPALVIGLVSMTGAAATLTPLFLFLFCIAFPRPLIQSPRIVTLLCIPAVVSSIPTIIFQHRMVYDPGRAFGMFSGRLYLGVNLIAAAYFFAAPFSMAAVHFLQKRISFNQCPAEKIGTNGTMGANTDVQCLSAKSEPMMLKTSAVILP